MRVLSQEKKAILLDKKDWRILREIVQNVRQPLSQIAQQCQLSRQSIEYRLQQMEKKQLLMGSRTVVNIRALGYSSYHVFLEVRTPEFEKELLKRAVEAPFVNALLVYSGKFNLEISLMAKNNEEFLSFYHQLVEGLAVREEHILVLLQTICNEVLPQRYFHLEKEKIGEEKMLTKVPVSKEKGGYLGKGNIGKAYIPDQLDLRLLFLLSRDARRTNNDLARELKLSKDAIKYRIRKLEQQHFLVQYRPVVNYAALGLTVNTLLVKLNYAAKAATAFETMLRSTDTVLWATRTFGYYDYIVYVLTKNVEEFHAVINQMKRQFAESIKTYEVLSAFEELKYFFMAENVVKKNMTESVLKKEKNTLLKN